MPKGLRHMAGVPKIGQPKAKNRTNMPRKPKVNKLGDSSMKINQKGQGIMKPPVLGKKQQGIPKPKIMKSKKPKVPNLNLPDPV